MVKFIYFCMAILVGSFIAVPIFSSVSKEHQDIMASVEPAATNNDAMSFEDIYAAADDSRTPSPESLNNIATAAGADTTSDSFSMGFSGIEDTALSEEKPAAPLMDSANTPE